MFICDVIKKPFPIKIPSIHSFVRCLSICVRKVQGGAKFSRGRDKLPNSSNFHSSRKKVQMHLLENGFSSILQHKCHSCPQPSDLFKILHNHLCFNLYKYIYSFYSFCQGFSPCLVPHSVIIVVISFPTHFQEALFYRWCAVVLASHEFLYGITSEYDRVHKEL